MSAVTAASYWISRFVVIGPMLYVVGRPRFVNRGDIPRSGPVILAANHIAVVDSFFLVLAARRQVKFLTKSDYFDGAGPKGWCQRQFFTALGQIPVDRRGGTAAAGALTTAMGIVNSGQAWGIHPEGTRSPNGDLHRGRTGVVRVALATGATVLPVAITGTESRQGWAKLRRRRVTLEVLPPLDLSRVDPGDDAAVREVTDMLMHTLAAATEQRYVDEYAKRWS